jgi:hypothetical protein
MLPVLRRVDLFDTLPLIKSSFVHQVPILCATQATVGREEGDRCWNGINGVAQWMIEMMM